ncbi:hypothetical protein OSB04_020640 [Centaurea solstitialis]|uniref:Uncharacterized protein n=1 Tax=Centaurea solstitialis TaxID=347529 RepID=A0AA38TB21_9ASTR|nr:hypothetical protein OSB04_020640 [Centaurea solstitialis]
MLMVMVEVSMVADGNTSDDDGGGGGRWWSMVMENVKMVGSGDGGCSGDGQCKVEVVEEVVVVEDEVKVADSGYRWRRRPQLVVGSSRENLNKKKEKPKNTRSSPSGPFYNHSKIVKLVYTATLFIVYQPLIDLIQMKFQNKNYSAFDTHGPFMNMSVIALYMTALTSGLLFYINDHLQSFMKGRFSLLVYVILEGGFYFSGILTPLSPTLVLLIPSDFSWIGYIIIGALFVIIVIYHWISYIKHYHLKDEFNSGAHPIIQDNEDISVFHRHYP